KVVILAGGGARGAGAALKALADKLDAPVISTTNARGLMHGHPLNLAASPSFPAVRALVKAADQVLAVGTEFGQTDYDMYSDGAVPDLPGMIRVDICADQLARQAATVRVCADASVALEALLPMVDARTADGAKRTAATLAAARVELGALSPKMAAQLVMVEAMRDAMPGSMIVGDSTQPVYAGNLCHDHDLAGGWFNAATGFGSLGYGPGAAVGAAIGKPGVPVICLVGDGGLQFSPGELRTAVDENLDITFLVWNSASYQEIAESMEAAQIEVLGCDPSPLKMEPFAAACDLPFQSVPNDPEALKAALRAPRSGPRMIEVVTF
ncbi:MAG: thiamine pyrophosphate-dependent enzyme, partial [Paracoccaceae bacterium]